MRQAGATEQEAGTGPRSSWFPGFFPAFSWYLPERDFAGPELGQAEQEEISGHFINLPLFTVSQPVLMRYLFLCCCWCLLLLPACSSRDTGQGDPKAQALVDQAIAAHGGEKFGELKIAFDFRGRHYTAVRQGGLYTYTRSFTDTTGQVEDKLTNEGLRRKINGRPVDLPAERQKAFSQSVNSVIYFALLPFGLNDPAVQKTYLGETTIKQQPYHKIRVTFTREGGGVDYEDEFIYWIHQETHQVDYLAYSYQTDGGGLRFRAAYQPRVVAGLRFQQYLNYEPAQQPVALADLDKLYEAGQLKLLSRIELQNIRPLE